MQSHFGHTYGQLGTQQRALKVRERAEELYHHRRRRREN